MDYSINLVFRKEFLHGRSVAEVHFYKKGLVAEYGTYSFVIGGVTIGHIVGNDHVISRLDEFDCYVTAYKAGAAGYKYCFFHNLQMY